MGDTRPADTTTALALAAGAGDRAALVAFVHATQRDVYRFLVHLCDRDDAEDLTQETYLRALPALPRFAGRSSARTWLLAIARRVAADQVRRIVSTPRTTTVDDWDDLPVTDSAHRRTGFTEAVLLRRLVANLEPDRRDAFVLTQMLGFSYADAAEVCGCPVGTIRSRVARAREDLIRAMNPHHAPGQTATGP